MATPQIAVTTSVARPGPSPAEPRTDTATPAQTKAVSAAKTPAYSKDLAPAGEKSIDTGILENLTSMLSSDGPKLAAFKARFKDGGARPNMFKVEIFFPSYVAYGAQAGGELVFLCKSSALPALSLTTNQISFKGRNIPVAAERTYAPWDITIYNETNFVIRNAFEQWSKAIMDFKMSGGKSTPKDYAMDAVVTQLDKNDKELKAYRFYDMWPSEIGQIGLDYDSINTIETFPVTFQYSYYKPTDI